MDVKRKIIFTLRTGQKNDSGHHYKNYTDAVVARLELIQEGFFAEALSIEVTDLEDRA